MFITVNRHDQVGRLGCLFEKIKDVVHISCSIIVFVVLSSIGNWNFALHYIRLQYYSVGALGFPCSLEPISSETCVQFGASLGINRSNKPYLQMWSPSRIQFHRQAIVYSQRRNLSGIFRIQFRGKNLLNSKQKKYVLDRFGIQILFQQPKLEQYYAIANIQHMSCSTAIQLLNRSSYVFLHPRRTQ